MLQPQAPELEETILGACLIEKEGMALIDELLKPEMFYVTRHQLIYAALQAMFHAGTNIDILTATEELRKRGKLDDAGGPFYITQLSSRVASSAHLEYHARIVHQKYIRREMIVGFSKLLTLSGDETIDLTDTLVDGHNLLDRLEGACGHNRQLRDMDTLMQATLTEAEGRMQKNKDGVTGIPTGLAELDKMTGGWQNSDLITIAARPAVGKTAFALHLAKAAAAAGHHTVVYSLEMQAERLGDRWLLSAGEMDPYLWRSGKLSQETWLQARQTAGELARLPICVDDNPDMSMDRVRSSARLLQSKGKCDFIIIDYLQLLDTSTRNPNSTREREIAAASRAAKLLAKELNIPVIMLSQLSRKVEERADKTPLLSDLRESGAIEQDADMVAFIDRPAMYGAQMITTTRYGLISSEGVGVLHIAKNREGAAGRIYFRHNESLTRITDYENTAADTTGEAEPF